MPDRQSEGNRSGLAEQEVNHPATEEVRPCAPALAGRVLEQVKAK
jgi:hypothetical protein